MAIHFYGGTSDDSGYKKFEKLTGTDYYYVDVPAGNYTTAEILRAKSESDTPWNYMYGIPAKEGCNLLSFTSWGDGSSFPASGHYSWRTYRIDYSAQLKLAGSWTDVWTDDQKSVTDKDVANGRYSWTFDVDNAADLLFKVVYNGEWFGAGGDKSIATQYNCTDNGGDDHNFKLTGDNLDNAGTVTIIVRIDDSGKLAAIRATFTPSGVVTVTGMPFYPAGVYGEEDFANLDANEKFYYLTGHSLNNNFASPEWQMTKKADDLYYIDFTWNDHNWKDADGNYPCPNTADSHKLYVKYYTKTMAEPGDGGNYDVNYTIPIFKNIPENRRCAGTRMRAYYVPSTRTLSFKYLTRDGNESEDINDAYYLPYISLVGMMSQMGAEDGVPEDIANPKVGDTESKTTNNWQHSWIQYDRFGKPVTSRDGSKVYFNTQWPPLHNVMFTGKYKDANGDHTVGFNSDGMTFERYLNLTSGADLKKMDEFKDVNLNDGDNYYVYKAEYFWAVGQFKLWSGWSGGANSGGGAEWNLNWNWGYYDPSSADNNDYTGNGRPGFYTIEPEQTVQLGSKNGDMGCVEPTYFNKVYFFLNLSDPNGNSGKSLLYARKAVGDARIEAMSNQSKSAGTFNPTVSADAPKVTSVNLRAVASNENDPDNRTILIFNESGLDWTASDFTSNIGSVLGYSAGTGSYYPAGKTFYHDGVNYPNSGWYEYYMDIKFEGIDETVTVKSTPFYVAKVENTLTVGQLIKINKDNAVPPYKAYDYITYSLGQNFAYGVKVAADTNSEGAPLVSSVTRLEAPSNDSYGNAEKATWTKYVLLYARRPWMGDNPDHSLDGSVAKSWTINYPGKNGVVATTEDAPLQFIVPASDLDLGSYEATLVYNPLGADGADAYDTEVNMRNQLQLRIPTPRMKQGYFKADVHYDTEYQDVKIAAGDHAGLVKPEDYTSDKDYTQARVRHLTFEAELDMPNADADLMALIPEDQKIRHTHFTGDAKLLELLPDDEIQVDLTNINRTYVRFCEQDLRNWLKPDENYTKLEPIKRQLRFDFARTNKLRFFERFRETGVTFQLTPDMTGPSFNTAETSKPLMYRYKYQPDPDKNEWKERVVLATTPKITAGTASLTKGHNAVVEPEHSFYAFKMNEQVVGYKGCDSDPSTNELIHYGDLTSNDKKVFLMAESEPFTWYAEMDQYNHVSITQYPLQVAHGYIFHTQRHAEFASDEGKTPALSFVDPAAPAPRRAAADSKHIVIAGPFSTPLYVKDKDILTSVDAIGSDEAPAGVAGDGFIELFGAGAVYTIDGRCVFQGAGRVDVEPGIYVIASPKGSYKVAVK